MTKTMAFFGASGGVGLSTLKRCLAEGYQCIALCREPSKLTKIFPAETTPNLKVIQGNAKDISAVIQCLQGESGKLVDGIVSTIGPTEFSWSKMAPSDGQVCRISMSTLLEALNQLRGKGITGKPYIVVCSTTGMSRFGRDTPLVVAPLYHVVLKVPHEDKRAMEDRLESSGEDFTIVRASLLTNGESKKKIRVGIEDPKLGRESEAIGYTISREDTGKWIFENLVIKKDAKYYKKIASVTY